MAKEKYIKHGTPLKYVFISLLWNEVAGHPITPIPFFSCTFSGPHKSNDLTIDNATRYCKDVNDSNKFIYFLKSKLEQQNYISMIVTSNASINEDRFYAILPSRKKYKHLINSIPDWEITDMLSVKLKLYEILNDNDGDLWDKARLLHYCSIFIGNPILPSFATYQQSSFIIYEMDNIEFAHKWALRFIPKVGNVGKYNKNDYEKEHGPIIKQNINNIQFNKQQCCISISADKYFIFDKSSLPILFDQKELSKYSLVDDDLELIYIPYFTYNMPDEDHPFPVDDLSKPIISGTLFIGNMNINRWILYQLWKCETYGCPSLCSSDGYTFNVY
ncbi:unnamed protein product [Cunninghamella blakesleeana]